MLQLINPHHELTFYYDVCRNKHLGVVVLEKSTVSAQTPAAPRGGRAVHPLDSNPIRSAYVLDQLIGYGPQQW